METASENAAITKRSGIKPPSTFSHITSSPPRALGELHESGTNARSAMPIPTAKHKPSGCTLPLPGPIEPDRPLTISVPEPAFKQRKTLAEQAAEAPSRRLPAPTKIANGVKTTTTTTTAAARAMAASTSRTLSKPTVRNPSTSAYGASVGAAPRASTNTRPKSAYGHGSHVRSKSYQQGARPATAMMHRGEDDDSDQTERKGVQLFLISTNPSASVRVPKGMLSIPGQRTASLSVSQRRMARLSDPRTVSSPCAFRPVTPVIEEPSDTDCDAICSGVAALTLGASKADGRDSRVGRGITSDNGTNPFVKPKLPPSQLPQPTPPPTRQAQVEQSPCRRMSTTPRRPAPAPFLNRFTNDRCPDFYNERMEAMERDFRSFKEKMETDVRQATDYKESISQLQSRVTELETIRARLEIVNKGLETELDDTRSSLKSVKMELEMAQQKHTYEVDDVRRRLRNDMEDLESRHRKDTDRLEREREEAERKTRAELEGRMDKLLKEHEEELSILRKKLDQDSEAERSRRAQEAQKIEDEYASKLRAAALEADAKQREAQLVQGELTNVKSELDRERIVKNGLQTQLTESTTQNLTLDAANKAMKEKIDFLESDSQAQSSAFNDLHKRMQDAIEAAERAQDKLRQEETLRRKLFNQVQELKGNIRVMCRVRPTHSTERDPAQISFPDTDTDSKEVAIQGPSKISATGKDITAAYSYSFDRVFGPVSQNGEVFEEISQLVQSALDGYNVCIFCYGQTGAGKTHTMSSSDGMIPRATAQIWDEAQRLQEKGWRYTMEGSFIEVYNETYNDLLGRSEDLDKKKVEVRHDPVKKQTNLENAVSVKLDGPDRVEEILETASKNRTVAATKANMRSSRSHSVFILKLVGTNEITGERSEGTLNLVDLAGSERLEHSKAEGARLKETQNINKSLSCLGDVINALGSSKEGGHIPYRNSKLTYLLQYSLGGNSKTLMFVMVSPLQAHLQETITSLKFATKVHNTHIGTAKKQTKSS
ncbi:carboxy-terminal kinesin 2 [Stemphylium lycopersici]|nr:carboxy-terminal kinesin 2 [Stemphylium lycopersici]